MKMHTLLVAIVMVTLFSACKKDNEDLQPEYPSYIQFERPFKGQKNQYVLIVGENYKDLSNHNFKYYQDTLNVEIIAEDENGFLIKEALTPGSASLNGLSMVSYADATFYYYLYIDQNEVKMRPMMDYHRARLFFLDGESEEILPLSQEPSIEIKMPSWKTELPYSESKKEIKIKELTLFGKKYENLWGVINNVPMKDQLPGHTHIYSLTDGLVRSSQYSWHNSVGFGWDLLPAR